MNSGPTGSVTAVFTMRSISSRSAASSDQPATPSAASHLFGVAAAPERNADALVEHPTHRQMDHAPLEAALCELIELPHGLEILGETGRLELRIDAPQIVAVESRIRPHAPAQQPAAERPIAERHDVVGATVGQNLRLDGALEQVIGRLQHVQRGHLAEALHLRQPRNCSRRWRGSFPARYSERMASAVSSTGTSGSGQWTW